MGFEIRRVFALDFEGTAFDGAIIKVRSASVGDLRNRLWSDDATVADNNSLLADHITEWNLTDDGKPLPISPEGIETLDPVLRALLIGTWVKAMTEVPAPLDRPSGGTGPSPAPLMTMETL